MEKHLVVSQLLRYNIKHVKSYILPLYACIILELALILMIQAIFFQRMRNWLFWIRVFKQVRSLFECKLLPSHQWKLLERMLKRVQGRGLQRM